MKPVTRSLSIIALLSLILYMSSCVTARKYEDEKKARMEMEDSLRMFMANYKDCNTQLQEMSEEYEQYEKQIKNLKQDTGRLTKQYARLKKTNEDLNELYEKAQEQRQSLLENSNREREKLAAELNEKEKQLNEKQQELVRKEKQLEDKENTLGQKEDNITNLRESVKEREQRVNQLESMIARKDSAVNALRDRLQNALVGFSDNELKIEKKDGKVYVSMSDKLLFSLGSTKVDAKGKEALGQLAEVMKKNPDIEIFVEGHTDSLPMNKGGCIEDNWDLSVMRATSIVKIMIDNGVDPKRLIPSGRSKYFPKATNETKEGRAQNRRTEIILSPKLDQIMNLLQADKK